MKDSQFYVVQGWMLNKLNLRGNELACYAIIYGFCQDEKSEFKGNATYIADLLGCTRESATKTLQKLTAKNLMIRLEKEKQKYFNYSVNFEYVPKEFRPKSEESSQVQQECVNKNDTTCEESSQVMCEETSQENNNINNNIYNNNKENKNNKLFLQKKAYGEFQNVMLTDKEMLSLISKYQWYLGNAIEMLSSYLAYKGDKYKSHYPVFARNNWVWDKVHANPELGAKPKLKYFEDSTAEGGMRAQTCMEYYCEKYNLTQE